MSTPLGLADGPLSFARALAQADLDAGEHYTYLNPRPVIDLIDAFVQYRGALLRVGSFLQSLYDAEDMPMHHAADIDQYMTEILRPVIAHELSS